MTNPEFDPEELKRLQAEMAEEMLIAVVRAVSRQVDDVIEMFEEVRRLQEGSGYEVSRDDVIGTAAYVATTMAMTATLHAVVNILTRRGEEGAATRIRGVTDMLLDLLKEVGNDSD